MKVYLHDELQQGTAEWLAVRAGIPTASAFHKVMAKHGPKGGTSHKEWVQREQYKRILAGEIITGEPHEDEWKGNRHTERGKEREDEARAFYGVMHEVRPTRIGFVRNGNCGASPDSFVGDEGGLEIKDAIPHRQIERLQDGTLPSEHRWQVIGSLLVCPDREWWDFVSHCRGLPLFEIRIERDKVKDELAQLREGIDRFVAETDVLVRWIKAMA